MNTSYLETYTKVDFTDFRTLSKSAHDDDGRGEKSNKEALQSQVVIIKIVTQSSTLYHLTVSIWSHMSSSQQSQFLIM